MQAQKNYIAFYSNGRPKCLNNRRLQQGLDTLISTLKFFYSMYWFGHVIDSSSMILSHIYFWHFSTDYCITDLQLDNIGQYIHNANLSVPLFG